MTQAVPFIRVGGGVAQLSGGTIQTLSGNAGFVAENGAVLETPAFKLTADKISIESAPPKVVATGKVRVAEHAMHDFVTLGDRAEFNAYEANLTVSGQASAEYANGEVMGRGDQAVINLDRREMAMTGNAHTDYDDAREVEPLHVYYSASEGEPRPRDMEVMNFSGSIHIRMVNYVTNIPAQVASIPPAGASGADPANTTPLNFTFFIPSSISANSTTFGQTRSRLEFMPVDEGDAFLPPPDEPLAVIQLTTPAPVLISANRFVQLGLSTQFYIYPEGQPRPETPAMAERIEVPSERNNNAISNYYGPSPRLPPGASQASTVPAKPLPRLQPATKYVVDMVQTIFSTPDPTGAGRKASENSGSIFGHGNTLSATAGVSPQLNKGPRQTVWTRTLTTTFTTGPSPNPRVPWPPALPAVATEPSTTVYPSTVASTPAFQVYEDRVRGFQFEAPKDWKINQTDFDSASTNWIVTVNNQRADLQVLGISKPAEVAFARSHPQETLGPAMVMVAEKGPLDENKPALRQMLPGEISLVIGRRYDQGGVTGNALSWPGEISPSDLEGGNLRPQLASELIKSLDEAELSGLDLRFVKRGAGYEIAAFLRAPIREEDKQKVLALLTSFHFVDAPVGNAQWAIYLARPRLSMEFLAGIKVDNATGRFGGSSNLRVITHTKKTATGYLVTFTRTNIVPNPRPMNGPPPPDWDPRPNYVPEAAEQFFVKMSGEVVSIENTEKAASSTAAATQAF